MRAMAVDAYDGPAALRLCELPIPAPAATEVRVRVRAAALNPADLKVVSGKGRVLHATGFPLVVGYDLSGVVDAVGAEVEEFAAGDEVFGFLPFSSSTGHGSFAEYTVAPAASLCRRPDTLDDAAAAALATAGATALQALRDRANVGEGDKVLVIGAAGGVGSLAVGVARALGARVTGVCAEKAMDLVRGLGAEEVIDYRAGRVFADKGTYRAVLDTPVVHSFAQAQAALKPGGTYLTLLPTPALAFGFAQSLLGAKRCRFVVVKGSREDLGWLAEAVVHGRLQVPIDSTFAVSELGAAMARLQRGGMRGRVVIDVEGGWESG